MLFTDADALYQYESGSGPIHYLSFQCSGNESQLTDCPHEEYFVNITNCGHHRDAGVWCSPGTIKQLNTIMSVFCKRVEDEIGDPHHSSVNIILNMV